MLSLLNSRLRDLFLVSFLFYFRSFNMSLINFLFSFELAEHDQNRYIMNNVQKPCNVAKANHPYYGISGLHVTPYPLGTNQQAIKIAQSNT